MTESSVTNIARHERIRREVLHKGDRIPSLPEVVTEVLRLLDDESVEISDFEAPLSKDASLVAKMLRIVNSPFYGQSRKITSIGDAVKLLGFRSLRSLILAASSSSYLERDYRGYGYDDKGLWHHSLCVASAAKSLAGFLDYPADAQETAFVGGLLHDVGKMLLAPYLREFKISVAGSQDSLDEKERQCLGIDHQEAGALIVEKWELGPVICEVVKHHHSPGASPGSTEEDGKTLAVVRVSDQFAGELGIGLRPGIGYSSRSLDSDLEVLGLDSEQWAGILGRIREAMDEAIASMGRIGA